MTSHIVARAKGSRFGGKKREYLCGRPFECKHIFGQERHVVRCGRVSGLVMRLAMRR